MSNPGVFDDWYYIIHDLACLPTEAPYILLLDFVESMMDNHWWEEETE